jgi:hypothetical protein
MPTHKNQKSCTSGTSKPSRPIAVLASIITLAISWGIGGSLVFGCPLDPIVITTPDATDVLPGVENVTVKELRYEFAPPYHTVVSGQPMEVSTITELMDVDISGIFSKALEDARPGLPHDSCAQIVDNLGISNISVAADGSLRVEVRTHVRLRTCAIFDYPCFHGWEITMCRSTNSITLVEGDITATAVITSSIADDKHSVKFGSNVDPGSANLEFMGVLNGLIGTLLPQIKAALQSSIASTMANTLKIGMVAVIGSELPDLEPVFNIDKQYRRLIITGATFDTALHWHMRRTLPQPRDKDFICTLRGSAKQVAAYERSKTDPITETAVHEGDSLWKIADQVYGDGRYHVVIARANNLIGTQQMDGLRANQTLSLPLMSKLFPQGEHLVQGKESLWKISGATLSSAQSFEALSKANSDLGDPNLIYPLQLLNIPSSATPSKQ